MRHNYKVFLAIGMLALAALACQALAGGGGGGSSATDVPDVVPVDTDMPEVTVPETEAPSNNSSSGSDILLEDDFSGGGIQWGTGTDADSGVEYVDDALNFQVFREKFIVWSTPNDTQYDDVHIEFTVINNGTDSNTAFGFMCHKQWPIDDDRYYFAVTANGQYAIAKSALAQDDVFLTNNDEWADSDLIAKDADSYRVGGDCANGKLTLYVDGQEIDSVEDSTYTSGGIALFAWSDVDLVTANVSFDDFVMTSLP